MKNIISQLNYPHVTFPGTPHKWSLYGCLASCLCMLLDKSVEEFVAENPTGWDANGNLRTDAVLRKYGYRLAIENLAEGKPLKPILTLLSTELLGLTHAFLLTSLFKCRTLLTS